MCVLQLSLVAFDDGVPEDRAETEISVTVRRNENPPTLPPNLGPYIISYEVRPGYVIVIVNATDGDGVSFPLCQVNSVIDAAPVDDSVNHINYYDFSLSCPLFLYEDTAPVIMIMYIDARSLLPYI